jgi:sugar (pentulose or hexulose) kinase
MNALALGLDIGTSGVRAAVLDRAGDVVGFAATKFAAIGGDRSAPATWRRAMEATLETLSREADLANVGAVAVDGTSGTMVAIDADGEPIGPARLYDEPCEDLAVLDRIAAVAPEGSAALGRTSALARVLTMQARPGVWKVVHQADWLAGVLSGRYDQSDENNALKTGYDPILRAWPDWIARAGADLSKLPAVHPPGARVATAGVVLQRFGPSAAALICAGTTDGCASFLATGASEVGDAVTALGSTLVIKLLSDTPIHSADYGVYSHRLGERWLVGGASNTGGQVIEALFPEGDFDALTAALRPEEPTGLHFYPLTRPGERFPINDPRLAPRLSPRPAERERFFQAVLEGIGEVEALAYRRLRELGAPPLKSVRSIGGGAANLVWARIRQDLIGAPFASALSQEACVGAARVALGGLASA